MFSQLGLLRAFSVWLLFLGLENAAPLYALEFPDCNLPAVTFDNQPIFTIEDIAGDGIIWKECANNFTGGSGKSYCVEVYNAVSPLDFETTLELPFNINLLGADTAALNYKLNYQDRFGGNDLLHLEISLNGGPWVLIDTKVSDVGTFEGTGVSQIVNLNAYIDNDIKLRFRYVDSGVAPDSGFYVQIDDLFLTCTGGADLKLDLPVTSQTVLEGDPLEFMFSANNQGPKSAEELRMIGAVPAGYTIQNIDVGITPLNMFEEFPSAFVLELTNPVGTGGSYSVQVDARAGIVPEVNFSVSSPQVIADTYEAAGAAFGPAIAPGVQLSGLVILADDDTGTEDDGCESLVNMNDLSGNIALLSGFGCEADLKVKNAQDAGAIAAIVYGSSGSVSFLGISEGVDPLIPSGSLPAPVTISTIAVSSDTGNAIKSNIVNSVNVTITGKEVLSQEQDTLGFTLSTQMDPNFNTGILFSSLAGGALLATDNLLMVPITVLRDADSDGSADLNEECGKDPAKIVAGVCGCGIADVDGDVNGILDCVTTDELKAKIAQVKKLLKKLKQGKQSKKLGEALKDLLKEMLDLVQNPVLPLILKKPGTNVEKLAKAAKRKGGKVTKTSSPIFEELKDQASKALNKFRKALA